MVRLGALLRKSRKKGGEPETQAAVSPRVDTPPLVVMIPDVAGVSSFRLTTFTDAQAAARFIVSLSRPQRERTHAFWALQREPADLLETEDNGGEAMVLIRSAEGSDLVYVVSFVDIESAQSFARFEVKRGMHLGLILIYWASMVNVILGDDKVQLIPERAPRVHSRPQSFTAAVGRAHHVPSMDIQEEADWTEAPDEFATEQGDAEEQRRLAAEAAEQARLATEAEEQRHLEAKAKERRLAAERARLQAEAEEQRRLEAEAEGRRLAAEAQERRLAAEAEERARLEVEAEEQRRLEAEAEDRRVAAEAQERRLAAEAEERARLEAEAEERRRLEEEAERWRLEAEGEERARLEAEAEDRRRIEADGEQRALVEAVEQERRRLEEEAEEQRRFEAAKRAILAQEGENADSGAEEAVSSEEAVAGSIADSSLEPNPIEELLRGEAESRVEVPRAFAKEPRDATDEASLNGMEHEINPADIADEVGKILRRRRWTKRESPFEGFKSPPGRF
ncbi:MAG: hypothetical protein E6J43_11460 [Chloroflexi bacterium]|nr:MAG: hypothetical protein E6J43_11460 [Chloroflexota bacterium]